MGANMPTRPQDVSLPLPAPTTEALREAVATIIRDLTSQFKLTDIELGGKLNVHANTIAAWRNKKNDMGALMIATIGTTYGVDSVAPYHALYGAVAHAVTACKDAPLGELAEALAVLARASGPKSRLDALPLLKTANEALDSYIMSIERMRIAA